MSKLNSTTVRLTRGRIHKHTLTFARRIIHIMTCDKTPLKTRAALRRTLRNLFDHTNIGRRRSLTNVNNVARVLEHTGSQRIDEGDPYLRAFKARAAMCRVLHDHDWATNPRLKRIAALMAERQSERLPRARRATRPRLSPSYRARFVQQIAA
jgi:hypothetical protein